jgi:hypothetical protein
MLDRDNCVARLRVLAVKLSQRQEGAIPEILAAALDTNPHTIEFPRHLVAFEDLAKRAREQIRELADDPSYEQFVAVIDKIITTFERLDMRENWNTYKGPFNPEALTLLGVCERAIQHLITTKYKSAGTLPDEEALCDVRADIQQAISGILDADIETEAKEVLLEMLREVERALQLYHISGIAGLRRAVERTLGAMTIHGRLIDRSRDHDAVKRVFTALDRFLIVADMIGYIRPLLGYLSLLPGVGPFIRRLTE